MVVGGTRAPVDDGLADSGYDYEQFSNLAGPLESPRWDEPYQVQYRAIHRTRREWLMTRIIAAILVLLDLRFIYWLVFQSQYPDLSVWRCRAACRRSAPTRTSSCSWGWRSARS